MAEASVLAHASSINTFEQRALDGLKPVLAAMFWRWFAANPDIVVVDRRLFGVFPVRVTISELRPLFVLLFGEPEGAGAAATPSA